MASKGRLSNAAPAARRRPGSLTGSRHKQHTPYTVRLSRAGAPPLLWHPSRAAWTRLAESVSPRFKKFFCPGCAAVQLGSCNLDLPGTRRPCRASQAAVGRCRGGGRPADVVGGWPHGGLRVRGYVAPGLSGVPPALRCPSELLKDLSRKLKSRHQIDLVAD